MSEDIKRMVDMWVKHGQCVNKHAFQTACHFLEIPHHIRQVMWSYMKHERSKQK